MHVFLSTGGGPPNFSFQVDRERRILSFTPRDPERFARKDLRLNK